jgi:hypothetical protein
VRRPPERRNSEEGNRTIAKEVERISLQRLRVGKETASHLNDAETGVEHDNDPECAAIRH